MLAGPQLVVNLILFVQWIIFMLIKIFFRASILFIVLNFTAKAEEVEYISFDFIDCVWDVESKFANHTTSFSMSSESENNRFRHIFFRYESYAPTEQNIVKFTFFDSEYFDKHIVYKAVLDAPAQSVIYIISSRSVDKYVSLFGYSEKEANEAIENCDIHVPSL